MIGNNLCAAISIGELGESHNKRIAMIGPFTLVGCFSIVALGVAIIRDLLQ
jgi:hypothetical protein